MFASTMIRVTKEDFEAELDKHDGEMRSYNVAGVLDSDGLKSERKTWNFECGDPSVIISNQLGKEFSYFFLQ